MKRDKPGDVTRVTGRILGSEDLSTRVTGRILTRAGDVAEMTDERRAELLTAGVCDRVPGIAPEDRERVRVEFLRTLPLARDGRLALADVEQLLGLIREVGGRG